MSVVAALKDEQEKVKLLRQGLAAKDALIDRLKIEAQGHAMEAEGANATIYAIYQAITGAKGEPGNWNGAQPVIDALAAKDATIAELRDAMFEQLSFLAMDLATRRGHADPDEIADIEYRRDRARAALEASR